MIFPAPQKVLVTRSGSTFQLFSDLRPRCCGTCISQEGTSEDDKVYGGIAQNGGSVVLAGFSGGNWYGTNSGLRDFTALELDPDGTVLWRWQVILLTPCPYIRLVGLLASPENNADCNTAIWNKWYLGVTARTCYFFTWTILASSRGVS